MGSRESTSLLIPLTRRPTDFIRRGVLSLTVLNRPYRLCQSPDLDELVGSTFMEGLL